MMENIKGFEFFESARADMERIVNDAIVSGQYKNRLEGAIVPEGLSLTRTDISSHWYLRKGKMLARLHMRELDSHTCFSMEELQEGADA
jgi:hypothetical protein